MKMHISKTSNALPSKRLRMDRLIHCYDQETDSKPVSPQSLDSWNTLLNAARMRKYALLDLAKHLADGEIPAVYHHRKIPQYLHDEETS